jgi:DNA-3-methyladenine glycosylase II
MVMSTLRINAEGLRNAEVVLAKNDPILGDLIERQKPLTPPARTGYFFSLCRSIIGQQVSVAAAEAIFERFEAATDMRPERIVSLSDQELRAVGLSRQKASYLRDLAGHFLENPNIYEHLDSLSDDEVIAELVRVKGIGIWSAQMFLLFTLGRPDVFAVDDVGIQRAMKLLYGWDTMPEKTKLLTIADTWRPYRSVACWYLWKSLQKTI